MTRPLLRSPPFPKIAPAVAAVSEDAPAADARAIVASSLFRAIREARVGGPFWAPPSARRPAVLVRPRHDADLATPGPDALHLLPATRWGRRAARRLRHQRIDVIVGEVDPWSLIGHGASIVAHGDDEWVALARIAGAPVRLLSAGRYATGEDDDRLAAMLVGVRYRDPFTTGPTTIERTIARLALWRRQIDANRAIAVAAGIAWWKRDEVERFLWAPRRDPLRIMPGTARAADVAGRSDGALAIWPSRVSDGLLSRAATLGVPLVRIEDGFLRSAGLGANLFPPQSITLDRRGIHYDPGAPSDLEQLLQTADIPHELLDRARALCRFVISRGISKYGDGGAAGSFVRPAAKRLVLVTGQVEDDLSVRRGGGEVAGNLDLLRRARAHEHDAEIWFRPHPDVDAGHRRGAVRDDEALRHADRVVRGGSIAQLLTVVDAVHVLTSLTGFEALMREREVVTHGVPFYAGWGLTTDLGSVPTRRTTRRSLDELIAAVLILYPRYLDPVTGLPCPVEVLAERLAGGEGRKASWLTRLRVMQGLVVRQLKAPTGR